MSYLLKGMFKLRIYLKFDHGKRIFIIAPIWLVKAGLGIGSGIAKKYIPEEQRPYFESIDFKELKKGFDVLKEYRGLKMVDIKAKDGTEVKIII